MVQTSPPLRVSWLASEALCARGDDLDESVHHGTRTLRRRRHCTHPSKLCRETRLAAPGSSLWTGLARVAQPFGVVRLRLSGGARQSPRRSYGRSDRAVAKREAFYR